MTEDTKSFVDLVLERMETNPEEFIEGSSKYRWDTFIQALRMSGVGLPNNSLAVTTHGNVLWALTEGEIKALAEQYKKVYREFLRREFIKNIMGEQNVMNPRWGEQESYVYKGGTSATNISNLALSTATMKPSKILTTRQMREQAEMVLQDAIEREAREGNWGAVSSVGGSK